MIENYIKYGAIVIGIICVLASFLDTKYIIGSIFKKKANNKPEIDSDNAVENDSATGFLEIVSLWYQLKSKCDHYNLSSASEKLDEVFPLLNKVLDNEA
jgi:hypothetical protein